MAGNPVTKGCADADLDRMDGRLGNRLSDLVLGCRVAHQVAELVRPVTDLVVGQGRDRAVEIDPVRRQRPVPFAVEQQALLAIDAIRRVEDFMGKPRVGAENAGPGFRG